MTYTVGGQISTVAVSRCPEGLEPFFFTIQILFQDTQGDQTCTKLCIVTYQTQPQNTQNYFPHHRLGRRGSKGPPAFSISLITDRQIWYVCLGLLIIYVCVCVYIYTKMYHQNVCMFCTWKLHMMTCLLHIVLHAPHPASVSTMLNIFTTGVKMIIFSLLLYLMFVQ